MKVKLFKQLCTDPIARDCRVSCEWYHEKRGSGYAYSAKLPGNPDVILHWRPSRRLAKTRPKIRREPRAPTAVCMAVLFAILYMDQTGKGLRFTSRRGLSLRALGNRVRAGTPHYQNAVSDALRLWQQLGVSWPDLDLPPPIKRVHYIKEKGRQVVQLEIELHSAWAIECAKMYRFKIKLPLPMHSTTQNMILKTMTEGSQEGIEINPYFAKVSGNKKCAKELPYVPLETMVLVKGWYTINGGRLEWQRHPYPRLKTKRVPSTAIDMRVWRP